MEEQQEEWKDVIGYEGRYLVSNYGRIKSLDITLHKCNGRSELRKGRIVKLNLSIHGYPQYLFSNGTSKRKLMRIHRVVAEAFIPNPDNKPCIDHINTIKTDNRVENLRWVTRSENNRNPITMTKYRKKGEYHHSEMTKIKIGKAFKGRKASLSTRLKMRGKGFPVLQFTKSGHLINEYRSSYYAQEATGIARQHIIACCGYKRKSAGGFNWRYKKEIYINPKI